jgi:LacI family transcriptional regulator
MQPVTMDQIARKLNLDQSTVSLALRNSPRVSASTKERVRAAANRMGYKTNPFVAALMRMRRSRSKTPQVPVVAWISCWDTPDRWMAVPSFKAFHAGARERLHASGFRLEHFWLDYKTMTPSRLSSILWNRGISRLIIAPVPNHRSTLDLDWEKFSAVAIGPSLHCPQLDNVQSAYYDAITQAFTRCSELGYRRVGLAIDTDELNRFNKRFLASYLVNCPAVGKQRKLEIFTEPLGSAAGAKAFKTWLRRNQPDVVVTLSRHCGQSCRQFMRAEGLKVPQDIGIVILSCHTQDDQFSGIYQFPELIGAQAAEILVRKVLMNEVGVPEHPLRLTLAGVWNPGTTLREQAGHPAGSTPRARKTSSRTSHRPARTRTSKPRQVPIER